MYMYKILRHILIVLVQILQSLIYNFKAYAKLSVAKFLKHKYFEMVGPHFSDLSGLIPGFCAQITLIGPQGPSIIPNIELGIAACKAYA